MATPGYAKRIASVAAWSTAAILLLSCVWSALLSDIIDRMNERVWVRTAESLGFGALHGFLFEVWRFIAYSAVAVSIVFVAMLVRADRARPKAAEPRHAWRRLLKGALILLAGHAALLLTNAMIATAAPDEWLAEPDMFDWFGLFRGFALFLILPAFAGCALVAALAGLGRPRYDGPEQCISCGYSLIGNQTQQCPECGAATTSPSR